MRSPRSQTSIEIVPGSLPLMSNWLGAVTSASAMSELVSDTRAIGLPMSISVERPTMSRTDVGSASGAVDVTAVIGIEGVCAQSTALCPTNATTRMNNILFMTYGSWRTTSCARLSPRMISTVNGADGRGGGAAATLPLEFFTI